MIYIFLIIERVIFIGVYRDFTEARELNVMIQSFMEELGFKKEVVSNYVNFVRNFEFVRFTFSKEMQLYFIEVASSAEEANINRYEDTDFYDASIPLNKLVEIIKEDIVKYYL